MTTSDSTPAQAASETCLILASFWANHPDLVPANVIYPCHLQLRGITGKESAAAGELVKYADAFDDGSVRVQVIRISERAFVYVHGRIDGSSFTCWEVVPDLAHALGDDVFDDHGHCWITVDGLRGWAADATAPEVISRPEPVDDDEIGELAGGVIS